MTKIEILDKLMILKESLKGQADNHFKNCEDPNGYNFGYGQACEKYHEWVEQIYIELRDSMRR